MLDLLWREEEGIFFYLPANMRALQKTQRVWSAKRKIGVIRYDPSAMLVYSPLHISSTTACAAPLATRHAELQHA